MMTAAPAAAPAEPRAVPAPIPLVKICGLRTPETLEAALMHGADMVGFVCFPRSPRHVELDLGRTLSREAAGRALRTLLLVDPTDRDIDEAVAAIEPDLVQLHGSETPERVAAIRARTGRPVMKAVAIGAAADLSRIGLYRGAADRILLDAKPPEGAALPGGNGVAFDWSLLRGMRAPSSAATPLCASLGMTPYPAAFPLGDLMLSGGLTPETVGEAIRISGLYAVDVSSGVESRPGEKDAQKIAAFLRAARAAFAAEQRREA